MRQFTAKGDAEPVDMFMEETCISMNVQQSNVFINVEDGVKEAIREWEQ